MAKIKDKDINTLENWNDKELRKLRMLVQNRITVFENSSKPKELKPSHPLYELDIHDCQQLLVHIRRAEKKLKQSI